MTFCTVVCGSVWSLNMNQQGLRKLFFWFSIELSDYWHYY